MGAINKKFEFVSAPSKIAQNEEKKKKSKSFRNVGNHVFLYFFSINLKRGPYNLL
jgi:hypothetical protein